MVLEHYNIATAPFACIPPRRSWSTLDFNPLSVIENAVHRNSLQSFPLFVKPASVSTGIGINQSNKVMNDKQLEEIVDDLTRRYPNQSILIESFLSGREFTVGIIGTGADAYVVGVRELVFLKDNPDFPIDPAHPYDTRDPALFELDVYGHDLKHQWTPNPQFVDLDLSDPVAREAADTALKAWRLLGCRDGGRIDIRHDKKGENAVPNFIEVRSCGSWYIENMLTSLKVNPIAGLVPGWSDLPRLAKGNGIDYDQLLALMMNSALKRGVHSAARGS